MKDPPTAVGGIPQVRRRGCRSGLNHPPTAVGGIVASVVVLNFQRPSPEVGYWWNKFSLVWQFLAVTLASSQCGRKVWL